MGLPLLGCQSKLRFSSCCVICFLRGRQINHDTQHVVLPYPIETRSPPEGEIPLASRGEPTHVVILRPSAACGQVDGGGQMEIRRRSGEIWRGSRGSRAELPRPLAASVGPAPVRFASVACGCSTTECLPRESESEEIAAGLGGEGSGIFSRGPSPSDSPTAAKRTWRQRSRLLQGDTHARSCRRE